MWTLAFVFTTMSQADPTRKQKERGSKRKKILHAVTSDAYNRRHRLRWNLVEKLRKLRKSTRSERLETIESLLSAIDRTWNIASERNYAF